MLEFVTTLTKIRDIENITYVEQLLGEWIYACTASTSWSCNIDSTCRNNSVCLYTSGWIYKCTCIVCEWWIEVCCTDYYVSDNNSMGTDFVWFNRISPFQLSQKSFVVQT